MVREPTPAERAVLSRVARLLGSRGAEVTNSKMTPEERKMRARKASAARWRKYHKVKRGERDEKG